MYICLCYAITEQTIRNEIKHGCYKLKDLQKKTFIGKSCGSCLEQVEKIIKQEKSNQFWIKKISDISVSEKILEK